MKITLAQSAGFCFGVKRALAIALRTAKNTENVEMLGDIVHNEEIVKNICKEGIKKISRLTKGKNKTLLICAHGACKKTFKEARRLGYTIIDATCPMVKEIHKIVRAAHDQGYAVIIIGDTKHEEVHGIKGQLPEGTLVIDAAAHIPLARIEKLKKAAVVTQSTQNTENVLAIVKILREHIENLEFYNTICNPTRMKQREIRTMPRENDVMVIIGSKTSANTKRLFELSKSLNERTYWIQSKNDLRKIWFKKAKRVGVTSGASTPGYTIKAVVDGIIELTG